MNFSAKVLRHVTPSDGSISRTAPAPSLITINMTKRTSEFDLPPEKRLFAQEWLCHDVRTGIFRYLLRSEPIPALASFITSGVFTVSDMEASAVLTISGIKATIETDAKDGAAIAKNALETNEIIVKVAGHLPRVGLCLDSIQRNDNWTATERHCFITSCHTVMPSKIVSICRTLSWPEFATATAYLKKNANALHAWMLVQSAHRMPTKVWPQLADLTGHLVRCDGDIGKAVLGVYPDNDNAIRALLTEMLHNTPLRLAVYMNERLEWIIWSMLLNAIDYNDVSLATLIVHTRPTIWLDTNLLLLAKSNEMRALFASNKYIAEEYWHEFCVSRLRGVCDVGRVVKARFCAIM